ncbi:hypothetical protein [Helicobacter sp. MIT 14-3879]|uniref:hypothetical protein n=1 Tax=Helicobacter sp. MIT 14-3879 TaxID=2040649 RepID=UPI000E1F0EB1|nr:hypothetical protein [Helicobacter sp. MIT 14-3879]RDU61645.1 hypothetical protein CQA44_08370 [Helicobacter sp. MIT 14-3879]
MQSNFKEELDIKIDELKSCQTNNNVDSCLKCSKVIGCEIRNSYVESVYNSMNGGNSGFFNFETE